MLSAPLCYTCCCFLSQKTFWSAQCAYNGVRSANASRCVPALVLYSGCEKVGSEGWGLGPILSKGMLPAASSENLVLESLCGTLFTDFLLCFKKCPCNLLCQSK